MRTKKQDRVAAGELLSSAGAAKGGAARAERLTPEERQAIARVGALERHGKLVRVRFTAFEYDSFAEGPKKDMVSRCDFEIEHAAHDPVRGYALIEQRITRPTAPPPYEMTETPEWVDRGVLEELAADYWRHVKATRIASPVTGFAMITEDRRRLVEERVYEFAVTDRGWDLVRWR